MGRNDPRAMASNRAMTRAADIPPSRVADPAAQHASPSRTTPLALVLVLAGMANLFFVSCRGHSSPPPAPAHEPSAAIARASATQPAPPMASGSVPAPTPAAEPVHSALDGLPPRTGIRPPFHPEDPAFADDPAFFLPKHKAQPGEWLARFPETGLSFDEYVRARPTMRTGDRTKIVLLPIGRFDEGQHSILTKLREFMEAFFETTTVLAEAVPLPSHGYRTRSDGGATWRQYRSDVLMKEVLAPNLPWDAVCYLGVTMSDLYPQEDWNYVFGQATLDKRVGVYSLARYFPEFWHTKNTPEARREGLLRSYKVLSHETGHMFSMEHCTRYECNMNGSNSREELDGEPAHLCPVCLKMLQWNLRFDVRARYRRLRDIYRRDDMVDEAGWIDRRLASIGPEPDSTVAK